MITSILLLAVAIILAILLIPAGVIYVLILSIIRLDPRKFWGFIKATVDQTALIIDMLGNVVCRDLLNDTMRTTDGYKFWKRKETISSVLGKNKRDGTLTARGHRLANKLDRIDLNHSIKSIDDIV